MSSRFTYAATTEVGAWNSRFSLRFSAYIVPTPFCPRCINDMPFREKLSFVTWKLVISISYEKMSPSS